MNTSSEPSALAGLKAIAFDKDGTLVDFHKTWDGAVAAAIDLVCPTEEGREGLAKAIGFDGHVKSIQADSPFVAESTATLDQLVEPWADPRVFEDAVVAGGAREVVAEPGAAECLGALVAAGVPLALVTNDSERSARAQLEVLGWSEYFTAVIGYDSGHGPKPEPGMILAAAEQLGVEVGSLGVVGDAFTDVDSARAAGAVAVLYGDPGDPALVARSNVQLQSLQELVTALG